MNRDQMLDKLAAKRERENAARRCLRWIGGAQCDNYRLPDSRFCAIHSRPKAER